MPSNKDILEAQRFNRRRLVTAFSAGTPDGKELEPRAPLRPLFAGIAIALVMLAVAAVMGKFAPVLPNNWENSTLIIVKGTGARYFTINGVLRPVSNITSAKLLSESGSYQTSQVSASTIAGIERGNQVGIVGIPDDVPAAASLRSDQWFTCALPAATHTWIAATPSGATAAGLAVVSQGPDTYIITGGKRHKLAEEPKKGVLLALGLEAVVPTQVSADWLNVFEQGSPLVPLEIKEAGHSVSGMPPQLSAAVIGTVVEVKDEGTRRRYVVTGNSTITPLTDTAERLYGISKSGAAAGNPLTVTVAEIANLTVDPAGAAPQDWPPLVDKVVDAESVPCAALRFADKGPYTELQVMPKTDALRAAADGSSPDPANPRISFPTTVSGGSGALVFLSGGGTVGAVQFISDLGVSHSLGINPQEALNRLGWKPEDALLVPAPWAALVPEGAAMTVDEAWQTVEAQ